VGAVILIGLGMPEDQNPYEVSDANLNLQPSLPGTSTELAGRGHRLLANLLDVVISVALGAGAIQLLHWLLPIEQLSRVDWETSIWGLAVYFGCFILINAYPLKSRGQTIGKILLGIRIVDAKTGKLPGLLRILVRRESLQLILPYIHEVVGILYFFVDACFIFHPDRRCVHDYIAGTKVVKVTA